jgi:hypothetical protein
MERVLGKAETYSHTMPDESVVKVAVLNEHICEVCQVIADASVSWPNADRPFIRLGTMEEFGQNTSCITCQQVLQHLKEVSVLDKVNHEPSCTLHLGKYREGGLCIGWVSSPLSIFQLLKNMSLNFYRTMAVTTNIIIGCTFYRHRCEIHQLSRLCWWTICGSILKLFASGSRIVMHITKAYAAAYQTGKESNRHHR